MRNRALKCFILLAVVLSSACATQSSVRPMAPIRLTDVLVLHQQGLTEEATIEQIEQRGLAFALTPDDAGTLRKAGVSEGVVRYLQGRATGERNLAQLRARDRFDRGYYYGDPFFLDLYGVGLHSVHGFYTPHHHHHH